MRPATLFFCFATAALAVPLDTTNGGADNSCVNNPTDTVTEPNPADDTSTPARPFTVEQLLEIVPKANTCTGAEFAAECRTATQAAPFILSSFTKYNITHAPVQAALISLIAYETGDFKYGINHYPGVLGQGTRNMQSPNFNEDYATSLGFANVTSNMQKMMDVLTQDQYSWGSAAWFVTANCPYSVRTNTWKGERNAWEAYLTGCVHTAANEERVPYWERAMKVLTGKIPA